MNYTLYRIPNRELDLDRVVMHMTDMNGERMDRFWYFGYADVFQVARIVRIWEGWDTRTIDVRTISRAEFIRKFGQQAVPELMGSHWLHGE